MPFEKKYYHSFPVTLFECFDERTPMHFIFSLTKNYEHIKEIIKILRHCGAKVGYHKRDMTIYSAVIADHNEVIKVHAPVFTIDYITDCLQSGMQLDIGNYRQNATKHLNIEDSYCMDVVFYRIYGWDSVLEEKDRNWIDVNYNVELFEDEPAVNVVGSPRVGLGNFIGEHKSANNKSKEKVQETSTSNKKDSDEGMDIPLCVLRRYVPQSNSETLSKHCVGSTQLKFTSTSVSPNKRSLGIFAEGKEITHTPANNSSKGKIPEKSTSTKKDSDEEMDIPLSVLRIFSPLNESKQCVGIKPTNTALSPKRLWKIADEKETLHELTNNTTELRVTENPLSDDECSDEEISNALRVSSRQCESKPLPNQCEVRETFQCRNSSLSLDNRRSKDKEINENEHKQNSVISNTLCSSDEDINVRARHSQWISKTGSSAGNSHGRYQIERNKDKENNENEHKQNSVISNTVCSSDEDINVGASHSRWISKPDSSAGGSHGRRNVERNDDIDVDNNNKKDTKKPVTCKSDSSSDEDVSVGKTHSKWISKFGASTASSKNDQQIKRSKLPTKLLDIDDSEEEEEISSHSSKRIKPRQPYSKDEQYKILNYIVTYNEYARIKGRELWVIMERRKVCPSRTWQSMKEHFLKKIIPNLDNYHSITNEQRRKIKRVWVS